MSETEMLGLIFAVTSTVIILFFTIGLILYLLFSFGLYKMSVKAGLENSWFAFIPILQNYLIGKLITEIRIGSFVIPNLEWVLLIAPIAYLILSLIPIIGFIVGILYLVLYVLVIFFLFKRYSEKATLMTIVSFIFPFMLPIFVFYLRDASPINHIYINDNNNY